MRAAAPSHPSGPHKHAGAHTSINGGMQSKPSERLESFAAARLRLGDVAGIVRVRERTGAAMQIRITGSKPRVERIECEPRGDVLVISDPACVGGDTFARRGAVRTRAQVFGPGVSFGTVGSHVHIADAEVVVSSSHGSHVVSAHGDVVHVDHHDGDLEIVVDVPPQTPITIEAASGRYRVDDVKGSLDVRLTGVADVRAGSVGPSQIDLGGTSRAEILAVSGRELRARIAAAGQLTVREGEVDTLIVTVADAGKAVFGGVTARADLSVTGTGKIRVNQVTESLVDRQEGLGRISVHVPPRRDPGSFWR